MDLIAQLIGFAGLIANVVSFQQKDRRRLLLIGMLFGVLMVVHFYFLGAYTAASIFLLAVVRAYLFSKFDGKHRPLWPLVVMLFCFLAAGVLTWSGPISLLPMVSAVFVTIGLWQIDTQRVRKFVLVGPVLWLIHNVVVGSIAGVMNELISLVAIIVGLWRHRKKDLELVKEAAETTP